jgi:phosphate transport system substrate-binding protein
MKTRVKTLLIAVLVLGFPSFAAAREQIRIVGSATVYPFVTAAAEQMGLAEKYPTPIVENTGTGGGFKLFCSGLGEGTPDISNASRRITESEKKQCEKNGVGEWLELPIGYDGIVMASKKGTPVFRLNKKQIFLALARELPDGKGGWVANPNKNWKQVDASLPDREIAIYGPPPTSGTRDAFAEMTMEVGCEQVPEFSVRYPDSKERKKYCHLLREDGGYIETTDDGNVMVQKLVSNDKALGILGFSFFDENAPKLQAAFIEGKQPSVESISSGEYSMSRGLYIYIKLGHIGVIPGIAQFMQEITSEAATGDEGYITMKGLLPLPLAERKRWNTLAKELALRNTQSIEE